MSKYSTICGVFVEVCEPLYQYAGSPMRAVARVGRDSDGDMVCEKHVGWQQHYVRRYKGWGFGIASVEQMQDAGATLLLVIDDDSGREYWAKVEWITERGVQDNLSCGPQWFLPLKAFKRTKNEALHEVRQLEMFAYA